MLCISYPVILFLEQNLFQNVSFVSRGACKKWNFLYILSSGLQLLKKNESVTARIKRLEAENVNSRTKAKTVADTKNVASRLKAPQPTTSGGQTGNCCERKGVRCLFPVCWYLNVAVDRCFMLSLCRFTVASTGHKITGCTGKLTGD